MKFLSGAKEGLLFLGGAILILVVMAVVISNSRQGMDQGQGLDSTDQTESAVGQTASQGSSSSVGVAITDNRSCIGLGVNCTGNNVQVSMSVVQVVRSDITNASDCAAVGGTWGEYSELQDSYGSTAGPSTGRCTTSSLQQVATEPAGKSFIDDIKELVSAVTPVAIISIVVVLFLMFRPKGHNNST